MNGFAARACVEMPINLKLAIDHRLGGWINSLELQLVGAKDDISQMRNELTTPAYALVNLRTGYQWSMCEWTSAWTTFSTRSTTSRSGALIWLTTRLCR